MSMNSMAPEWDTPDYRLQEQHLFYTRVNGWVAATMLLCAVGAEIVGPHVPRAFMMPLYIVALVAMIVAGIFHKTTKMATVFAVVIPFILGIILYPTLDFYTRSGNGSIITEAAVGTCVTFALMAVAAWKSTKALSHRVATLMFFTLWGMIGVSLLNAFVFHLRGVSLLVSIIALPLFCAYIYLDVQRVKNRTANNPIPPQTYALNIFLDIFNLFVNLLQLFGFFSRS